MIVKITTYICICFLTGFISCNKPHKTLAETNNPHQSTRILTDVEWLEDLEELYGYLKEEHRNLYHTSSPSDFETLYEQIQQDIPRLSDHEIIVQFSRLVALVRDGHTRLTLPLQEGVGLSQAHSKTPLPSDSTLVFRHLPVEFFWFNDGLHITKATEAYNRLIGKKVLRINNTSTDEALEKIRAFSHYDNESGYKLIAPSKLSIMEVLRAVKIAADNDTLNITVEQGNTSETITLLPLARFSKTSFFDKNPDFEIQTTMLSGQKNTEYYWYEYIKEHKTLYVQLNQVNNAKSEPDLLTFIKELDTFIKTNDTNRMVLDLRNNFGGNNTYGRALVDLVVKNSKINTIGRFYTLIGRKTFSAAQYLVNDLRKWTNVIFVGEPTGASPNSYGDSKKKQLTHSHLTARIASIYWRDWTSNETREWTAPDIPVPYNASDFFQNKDEALRTCLNFDISEDLADTYARLYETGGMETAERLYLRIALDWERNIEDVKRVENKLVQWMSEARED